ncbi:MAG TPA: hypothetical protein VLG76_04065 [Rhabdochlamydiaceae bacterium]|nr:hypothetical protein [Rhabdochlamydiaceae bacterium]HSX37793.1 hypothetical protein [Chlamydiales bacterium]
MSSLNVMNLQNHEIGAARAERYVPTVSGFFCTVVWPAIRKTPDALREAASSIQNAVKSFFTAPPREKMIQIGDVSLFVIGIALGAYLVRKTNKYIEYCFPNHPRLAKGIIFSSLALIQQSITEKIKQKPSNESPLKEKKIERLN